MAHRTAQPSANPKAHIRATDRPWAVWAWAAFWLLLAALTLALPFIVILSGDPRPAIGFSRDFALGLGFSALALAGLQFALTGRLKPLLHPFGADVVFLFHRFVSWGAVALMLGHFGILYLWHHDDLGALNPLVAPPHMTAGRVALLCFVALILSSELRQRIGLGYLNWRRLHVALALTGFGCAIWHVLGAGHFTGADGTRALWLAVTLIWLGLIAYTRLLRPWRQWRNPWRVIDNRDEGDGIRTLTLRPQGQPLSGWRPGQFAWLTVGTSPFSLREHPFTISTAPEKGPEVSFSIKPLGDDSARLSQTEPGTIAYIDGPYGQFSIDREAGSDGFVMIAGGVGITPIIANLHAMQERRDPRSVFVLYANESWDDVAFRDELTQMAEQIRLTVIHVIQDPPDDDWPPEGFIVETGRIDGDMLSRLLPQTSRDWPHMLCGPPPMLKALKADLQKLGVPVARIDSEIFEMV
ncbi:MAG: ferric reductase-like transmembrane domain-containing protein [Paracoccus sp. (in: a-proteobacteria)]|uniref:ferredoxin reductase family protein n=1 Tax=Paracoccus sp. TaxID=267 RepID=UPI0026E0D4AA|nr:ferric reductase-like transmembrane domain-containing protein [Paracoccus sp. (in: a-proteobacteria)]MDO5630619.1 ferric reductase-like transmembrane domain-containing protein [Paracoccus sp. (in: a-proteobacteria)]